MYFLYKVLFPRKLFEKLFKKETYTVLVISYRYVIIKCS